MIIFSFIVALSGIINLVYLDFKIASLVHIRFAIFSLAIFYILEKYLGREININKNFLKFFLLMISFIIFDSLVQFFLELIYLVRKYINIEFQVYLEMSCC